MRITRKSKYPPSFKKGSIVKFNDGYIQYMIELTEDIEYDDKDVIVKGTLYNYTKLPNRSEFIMGAEYTFRFDVYMHPIS